MKLHGFCVTAENFIRPLAYFHAGENMRVSKEQYRAAIIEVILLRLRRRPITL